MRSLEKTELDLGFVALVDGAPLIVARERGFFADEGLSVRLVRQASWAAVRDLVGSGVLDGAHMLAAMPLASALGLSGRRVPMTVPMSLNVNGNGVTLSTALAEDVEAARTRGGSGPLATARALRAALAKRRADGLPPPTFGVVFPYSSHNYMLRYWLAAGGIDPDRDVRLLVVPPPQMITYLTARRIDGYCVGAPWNSLAERLGVGRVVVNGYDIWNNAPEKVLAVTTDWAERHPVAMRALLRALIRAAAWLRSPANHAEAAYWLSNPEAVNAPADAIEDALATGADTDGIGPTFDRYAASLPWRSHARWTLSQMRRWGQMGDDVDIAAIADTVYRPEPFRLAASDLGQPVPADDFKREGVHAAPWSAAAAKGGAVTLGADLFCDGRHFDPMRVDAYLAGFDAGRPATESHPGRDAEPSAAREARST
ncbi:MAG: ABC transporter substrate-binding protein [Alphaproteobacteria bacterium]|nr:ABC transporter substrate-binding protein [Alphaproteobacteria bacterium]MCW5740340.1 ABC transporter substrate-binding protein [Alphaproteobacteria bacterium]